MKKALITGITGQDGAYLSELLIKKGYEVHGLKRRSSSFNTARIDHLFNATNPQGKKQFHLHHGDITDSTNIIRVIQEIQPDEIYNLAAQSHVAVSFESPEYTAQADALGPLRILEAIHILGLHTTTRFYQASTSELFGNATQVPQTETTPFSPRSPYAAAKLYAYWITVNYREAYNIFAVNGILFNHESPIRGETFVTRKITRAVANIHYGLQDVLYLGNLDAKRDWGYAKDYVQAMWLMLQHEEPVDLVIATGVAHSVRDFVQLAFAHIDIEIEWVGYGLHERGINKKTGKPVVLVNPRYFRPTEVNQLIGNPAQAKKLLGWQPTLDLAGLVKLMVTHDLQEVFHKLNFLKSKTIDTHFNFDAPELNIGLKKHETNFWSEL